jgi:Cof subfamily protein (haloacid dehalogenase superfamily)
MTQIKQQVKMIVSDLDGTLLRTDKNISENTKNVINQCRKLGIKVVYATGLGGSAESRVPSHLFDGKITMNGAIAKINDIVVYNCMIPFKVAQPLLIACDKYGLKTTSELSGMHYSNFNVTNEWPSITNFEIVDFSKHEIDAEKIYMVIKKPDDIEFIKNLLSKDIYLTVSKDGLGQVMHKNATISKAIAELAKNWNIKESEIVAFGDDLNDIDMIKYAGIGVAMENALDEVKSVANSICPNNDEDGVAQWINKNII